MIQLQTADVSRRALIEEIFEEALDVTRGRRDPWLAARCGSDVDLRVEVEGLLATLDRPDLLLDGGVAPFARIANAWLPHVALQQSVGPYKLIRELGRGGMGAVYLAERTDGQFQRRVAIKVLLPGAEATALHRRFLAERQILATLSHTNIAQLIDGGIAEDGAPYLVMEYVDGVSITAYCEREQLGIPARLRLFQDVCAAVHHAHRNLVLHRDVKPGNILVSHEGRVKLLDFGIAKLLDTGHGAHVLTRTDGRPMTPAYASPEQMRGQGLSTASDVYALGLVLYEMLTGVRAYDVEGLSPHEAFVLICDQEPARPSTRVPARARALAGDLDAIVMMALRKEPDRRYGSADLLSADIARYLEGLPVLAHRGSAGYRLSKVVRRHRTAVVAGGLLAATLVTGTTVAVRQARIADLERARATAALQRSEVARRQSDVVTQYLIGMFEPGKDDEGRRDTVSTEELLRRGLSRAERLADEPRVQAQMFDALSRVHQNTGDLATSASLQERAARILEGSAGSTDSATSAALERLAELRRITGDYAVAERLARRALDGRRQRGGDAHPDVASSYRQLAGLAVYRGALSAAESLSKSAVAVLRRGAAPRDSLLGRALETLASIHWRRGHVKEALSVAREAEATARRFYRLPHVSHAGAVMRIAEIVDDLPGGVPEADRLARESIAEVEAAAGTGHLHTATALVEAANVIQPGHAREREDMLRRALGIMRRTVGPTDPNLLGALTLLRRELMQQHRLVEAEQLATEAVRIALASYGPRHSVFAATLGYHGDVLLQMGRIDSAEVLTRRAIAVRTATFGDTAMITRLTQIGLARIIMERGRLAEADSLYTIIRTDMVRHTTAAHPDIRMVDTAHATLRARWPVDARRRNPQ